MIIAIGHHQEINQESLLIFKKKSPHRKAYLHLFSPMKVGQGALPSLRHPSVPVSIPRARIPEAGDRPPVGKSRSPRRKALKAKAAGVPAGCLITFEGIEGSGKSSQIAVLAEYLEGKGWKVLKTREPGGTKLGEAIRNLLLDPVHLGMSSKAELLLYLASRVQHLQEVILPALREGKIVLCDRFSDATIAYQGYGRGLDLDRIKNLEHYATEGIRPDLTILLDVETHRGLMRINARNSKDRLERERIEFYEKVRQGYLKLAKMKNRQIVLIDANPDFEKVARRLQEIVQAFLEKNVIPNNHRP